MEEQKNKTLEILNQIEEQGGWLSERKHELNQLLSEADKKKLDIEHYIEFYSLSASQGYKAAKMLKDCLEERRRIKDEMALIEEALKKNIGFIRKGSFHEAVSKQANRKYRPRILEELFNS